jgi:putative methionine-R-sulfoxide reductase with GAF domain
LTRPDQQATAVGGDALNGRYEIIAPISSGAMGAVYRAFDRETNQEVAVKRLLDVRHAARFEIEARLLASLSHPRVVKVLDHSGDEQGLYIVMELVQGEDLGALLKRNGNPGLSIGDAVEYVRHGCEALQYVHSQQIVHRDVKPQNMILGEDGVVLVDFGVARAIASEEASDQGTIAVGTPRFMAPEVFAGGTVSAASDIFSLAATLWTLLIGTPPRYGDVLKLDKIAPGLPPELREALAGGLEMLPEQRISSAAAFAEAIGVPLSVDRGHSLAQSLGRPSARRRVMEAIVRTAAGMFEAAACSIALTDPSNGELVYEAAWGAGASEVVGMRLPPGVGIAGAVVASGEGVFVPECRKDPRFARQVAAGTGYVPYTMVVAPLVRDGKTIGVLSVLDRRDGGPYLHEDLAKVSLFADLAVVALDLDTFPLSTSGGRTLLG